MIKWSNWLLLIRSLKISRDLGFYGFAADQKGFTKTLILTITPKLFIGFITLTTTLTQALNNRILVLSACHMNKTVFGL